jgi:Tol biopolymer transport system component
MKTHILCNRHNIRYVSVAFLLLILTAASSFGQYFGRNKPSYRKFDYDVVRTPNFEIYHYLDNDSMLNAVSQWSEKWYLMHQKVFRDTFRLRNPIILYSNHADFQQTNTISSLVGTGTGGVTESLKNRVIMPVAASIAQTDHVLGHELVHAFQYNMFINRTSNSRDFSINNIPLWLIEGMAEYLSKGSVDPHTSMVMRDAILNKDFPSLKKLSTDPKYFPYTYGQAFWAMAAKTWGDRIMIPLLRATAAMGFDRAADSVLKVDETTLSGMWKSASELHFSKYLKSWSDSVAGSKIISKDNAGEINISPSISPDGKYIAFFSEKDVFTLDLYLADALTGKIIKKLSSVVRNNEIDDFNFIESSGTWSPDGSKFAFVIFRKGANNLAILDVKKGRIRENFRIPGVASFSNPAWSPDGSSIVVSGLVNGVSDLYLYNMQSKEVEKLTDTFMSDIHPSWSPDGRYIAFSSEKPINNNYAFDVAILDMQDRSVRKLDVFGQSFNLNPVFSPDNKNIYFLSDADGFRNLFSYDLESDEVSRLTRYMTGISGITPFSPALAVSSENGKVAYNYYFGDAYHIYTANEDQFRAEPIDRNFYDAGPATLPPMNVATTTKVDERLYDAEFSNLLDTDSITQLSYRPKFKLDYISNNANVGVSTGLYRNNLGGSVNMIFGDMVGNHQIYSSLSLNGEIYDFGGQVAYLNQKSKIKWGAALSHIPYLMGNMSLLRDSLSYDDEMIPVTNLALDYFRIFEDNISLFAAYPLSQTRRFEATLSSSWYYYRLDRFNNYYLDNGIGIGGKREKLPSPGGENYQQVSMAYVEDNSYFGLTAPMQGHRARFQVEKYFGDADIFTTLIDYRKYFYVNPVTFAFRLYNYGMYGKGLENGMLPRLYLGSPWFIRGYENVMSAGSFGENTFDVSWLTGSRIAVANAEVRLPFTGPEKLALIKSKLLFTDLNLFFDSGIAWGRDNKVALRSDNSLTADNITRSPIMSTGASLRINVFGYLILEPYYAFPLQNGGFKNGTFGFNLIPGW